MSRIKSAGVLIGALACCVVLTVVLAPTAHAAFGLAPGSFHAGVSNTQAGAHPDAQTDIYFNTIPSGAPDGNVRTIEVDLPPGIVGNPRAVPRCPAGYLTPVAIAQRQFCLRQSMVGVVELNLFGNGIRVAPVFNLVPQRGKAASLGFNMGGFAVVRMDASARAEDNYALRVHTPDINETLPVVSAKMTLWGIPADNNGPGPHDLLGAVAPPWWGDFTYGGPGAGERLPFLTNGTECGVDAITTIEVGAWQSGYPSDSAKSAPTVLDGCDRVPFDPEINIEPDVRDADSPTGLAVGLRFPQSGLETATGLATAHLRDARVDLPEGLTISPGLADGLDACTDAQLGIASNDPEQCPGASKIGDATAVTPLLDEQLKGSVYVGSQLSDDPESGEMFRIFLTLASDERGIRVKLRGAVRADSRTGRLSATFVDNPQLPVSEIDLRFKGGPRAPLATPAACGSHRASAELTSWAGHVRGLEDRFAVSCPGVGGFAPFFEAGTVSPTGGAYSPLVAGIARDDRQQFLSGVQVDLPQGLLAKLAGVEKCGGFAAEHGGCPAGSRIGTATAGAGAGSNPFYVQGDVFLTEGYRGAPYGMAVHVHAKAGPFDLGWVRVRQALHVDRATAQVSVVSDPLPQVVKGVPVRLRTVNVDVDRSDFTINPTSCDEKQVDATLTSIDGAVHKTATRFQVGDCQALPFKPRLGLRLTGRRQRTTGKHPGVRAVVRQTGVGEAGIERARVVLPKSLALDPENAQALCEYEDGIKPDLENHCPKGSIVGRARAKTPLLDRDLVGDVYFVKNVKRSKTGNLIRTLPMIVVALRGEIAINLRGVSSTTRSNRLVNTFASVPDAPITRFNLNIRGGKTGILAVTRTRRSRINLCTKPRSHIANNRMNGHNGKRAAYRVRVKTPCGGKKVRKGKAGKRRG